MADFVRGAVRVRSPATSANLGPGFDSFGLCLSLFDEVAAEVTDSGLRIEVTGEGAGEVPSDESHLVVRAMRATFDMLRVQPPGLRLTCSNAIPHRRGLGSSAAAIVAGVRLAGALAPGVAMSADEALVLAAELEGHPDNVAACLLGGLTVAWRDPGGSARAARLDVHPDVRPVAAVSPDEMATDEARGLLPALVPHEEATANAARAGLLVAALTEHPAYLLEATRDFLHQTYRGPAMPDSVAVMERLRAAGVPAVLSGAGPSVLAFDTREWDPHPATLLPSGWRLTPLQVWPDGAVVES